MLEPSTLVLFDIDGTILLTAGAGRRALRAALATEVGPACDFEGVRFDGKTDPQIVVELLETAGHPGAADADFVRGLCRRYIGLLAEELNHPRTQTTLMPGVLDLLDCLLAAAPVGYVFFTCVR